MGGRVGRGGRGGSFGAGRSRRFPSGRSLGVGGHLRPGGDLGAVTELVVTAGLPARLRRRARLRLGGRGFGNRRRAETLDDFGRGLRRRASPLPFPLPEAVDDGIDVGGRRNLRFLLASLLILPGFLRTPGFLRQPSLFPLLGPAVDAAPPILLVPTVLPVATVALVTAIPAGAAILVRAAIFGNPAVSFRAPVLIRSSVLPRATLLGGPALPGPARGSGSGRSIGAGQPALGAGGLGVPDPGADGFTGGDGPGPSAIRPLGLGPRPTRRLPSRLALPPPLRPGLGRIQRGLLDQGLHRLLRGPDISVGRLSPAPIGRPPELLLTTAELLLHLDVHDVGRELEIQGTEEGGANLPADPVRRVPRGHGGAERSNGSGLVPLDVGLGHAEEGRDERLDALNELGRRYLHGRVDR